MTSTTCTHNWLLQSPDHDGVSAGCCTKCGAKRNFDGGSPWTARSEHPQRRTQSGWRTLDHYKRQTNQTRMSDDDEDEETTP